MGHQFAEIPVLGIQDQVPFEGDHEARRAESQETIFPESSVAHGHGIAVEFGKLEMFDSLIRDDDFKEAILRQ